MPPRAKRKVVPKSKPNTASTQDQDQDQDSTSSSSQLDPSATNFDDSHRNTVLMSANMTNDEVVENLNREEVGSIDFATRTHGQGSINMNLRDPKYEQLIQQLNTLKGDVEKATHDSQLQRQALIDLIQQGAEIGSLPGYLHSAEPVLRLNRKDLAGRSENESELKALWTQTASVIEEPDLLELVNSIKIVPSSAARESSHWILNEYLNGTEATETARKLALAKRVVGGLVENLAKQQEALPPSWSSRKMAAELASSQDIFGDLLAQFQRIEQ